MEFQPLYTKVTKQGKIVEINFYSIQKLYLRGFTIWPNGLGNIYIFTTRVTREEILKSNLSEMEISEEDYLEYKRIFTINNKK